MHRMRRTLLLAVAPLCFALPACSGADSASDDAVAATFEPIVGGVPATDYPEAALLNIDVPANGGSYSACSATVIAPRVVLTAGHCVTRHSKWEVYDGSQYRLS